jgi:YHS domain-containing protein
MSALFKATFLTAALLLTAAPAFAKEMEHVAGKAARAKATKAFDHKPEPGEKAICPVSKEVFIVEKDTKTVQYKGKWYAFCCDDCPSDFDKVKKKL